MFPRLSGLLYYSFADAELDESVMRYLLERARIRNRENQITGQLHFENGIFIQWLEGTPKLVRQTMDIIKRDPHHSHINILFQGKTDARFFEQWEMAYSDLGDASLLSFMLSNQIDLSNVNKTTVGKLVEFLAYIVNHTDDPTRNYVVKTQPYVSINDYFQRQQQSHG